MYKEVETFETNTFEKEKVTALYLSIIASTGYKTPGHCRKVINISHIGYIVGSIKA